MNGFVDQIVAADPNANVIVLGDVNDFDFSETVHILEGGVMTTLMDTLPLPERYSYVFEGNSQVLDQILVSDNLLTNFPIDYDPVHVNAEFADQASDHDPRSRGSTSAVGRRRSGNRSGGEPDRAPPPTHFASSVARDSRITVTLICPGYSSSCSMSRAIWCERRTAPSSSISPGLTITRISRPA